MQKKQKKLYRALIALDIPCVCGELHGVLWSDNTVTCNSCQKPVRQTQKQPKNSLENVEIVEGLCQASK